MSERSIFMAALEQGTPQQRSTYLDQACAGDTALRQRVEALLRSHEQAGEFLRKPAPQRLAEKLAHSEKAGETLAMDQPSTLEQPDMVIGPYKLIHQIGEGGMGEVWLAQQSEPVKRLVALKLIKAGMDSRQVIARFEAERQALALMDHANIARVFDGGTTRGEPGGISPGRPYFVMDLVKGVPITQFCDDHRLSVKDRLELFVQVCHAAQHAHQKGILHRDLKPSNVLVALSEGKPVAKVIDFGVAKAMGEPLTEQTLVTSFGAIVGTLEYMSPEQAEINQIDIDTRSDIYSLGVLLYELLTGSPPFRRQDLEKGGMLEMLRVIREFEPIRPSTKLSAAEGLPTLAACRRTLPAQLTRLVGGELDWVVMRALEKDRNRRYESAMAFAADVQRYLAGEAVAAVPPSAGYRLRKFAWRHRGPLLAASLVILALVAGVVGTTWGMVRAILAKAEAISEAKHKETALTVAKINEQKARDNLWRSLYEQARARRYSRRIGQRTGSLDALLKGAAIRPDEQLRDEAIAAMALPDVSPGPTWHVCPRGTQGWAFDAEYRHLARASDQGGITILSLPDNRQVQRIDRGSTTSVWPWFSRDGKYLAAFESASHTLRIWRVADGKALLRDGLHFSGTVADFSPDSRHLVVGQQGWVVRFDLATGQEVNRWQLPGQVPAHHLAFHPDSCRLAIGYRSSSLVSVYDATNGKLVANLQVGPLFSDAVVAWHPDGERLAVAGSDPRIEIWNVAAKGKVATLVGHVQRVTSLSFHPDGELIASGSWDGTLRLWDPSTGRQLMQMPGADTLPRFSSDGRWMGAVQRGEHAQLLEVTPPLEYRTLSVGNDGWNRPHAISRDGRLLALNLVSGARLFHLPSGRELATLPPGRPLFHSDTELLIVGPGGLHRWPIQPGAAANELRLGPPRTVPLPTLTDISESTSDGRRLAILNEREGVGMLVDLATDSVLAPRMSHPMASFIALSPDGRWVASGGWHSKRVRLWNAETGKMAREWLLSQGRVFFTPDSRALIISQGDEISFHDVATFQPVRRIRRDLAQFPGHVAFSPNGRLMAVEMAPGIIHLRDAASDRIVAKLEDPHGDRAGWLGFTPDGTQLMVNAPYARAFHVWDLRAIRQRLKGMGLDWDWPEFPATRSARDVEPGQRFAEPALKVQVVPTDPQRAGSLFNTALALQSQGELDEAMTCYGKVLELDPSHAGAHSGLGLIHARLGQWDKAVTAYGDATRLDPGNIHWLYRYATLCLFRNDQDNHRRACRALLARAGNTSNIILADATAKVCALAPDLAGEETRVTKLTALKPTGVELFGTVQWFDVTRGLVEYRRGRFLEAVKAIDRSSPSGDGIHRDALAYSVLAMAQSRLGKEEEARAALTTAQKIIATRMPRVAKGERLADDWPDWLHCQVLCREAEALLKTGKPESEKPN